MNEQANKILADLLQKASNGIDSAVSFSQAQIPDVVHQLLLWNAASSALFQAFILVFLSFYAWSSVKAIKNVANGHLDDAGDTICILWAIFGGVAGLILFICFWFNFDWLKIWIAPKLYLIEYAASLVK
ncbi:hypothetical protein HV344_06765 [Citrobacter freundii]|uniref:hypothetical protein n=1 Tax=Citrobacter freundii TaxID=546 RepID=UPI0015EA4E9E|nr:hypothetical protein [Citrobacter freundii]QLR51848.1 hypothetical protein HV344_06765 [Citrobacter freundii]